MRNSDNLSFFLTLAFMMAMNMLLLNQESCNEFKVYWKSLVVDVTRPKGNNSLIAPELEECYKDFNECLQIFLRCNYKYSEEQPCDFKYCGRIFLSGVSEEEYGEKFQQFRNQYFECQGEKISCLYDLQSSARLLPWLVMPVLKIIEFFTELQMFALFVCLMRTNAFCLASTIKDGVVTILFFINPGFEPFF